MADYKWGMYYSSVKAAQPNSNFTFSTPPNNIPVNSLTMQEMISLYLYGQTTRPADISDYIRAVDSPGTVAEVDMSHYMTGPGTLLRPAAAYEYQLFANFFDGQLDAFIAGPTGAGTYSKSASQIINSGAGVANKYSATLSYKHVEYTGRSDWKTETFIWNSVRWEINDGAHFEVTLDTNGNVSSRRITGLTFTRRDDNYDYITSNPISSGISKFAHGLYHDPFNIGKIVALTFKNPTVWDTSFGQSGETWDETAYRNFREQAVEWYGGSVAPLAKWASLGEEIAAELSKNGGPLQYQKDGHSIILGTALDDVLQSYNSAGEEYYYSEFDNSSLLSNDGKYILFPKNYVIRVKGDILYGGFGNDVISGADYNDVIFGGKGSDELFGYDGYDEAALERIRYSGLSLSISLAQTGIPLITRKWGIAIASSDEELNGDKLFEIEKLKLTHHNDSITIDELDASGLDRLSIDMGQGEDSVTFNKAAIVVNGAIGSGGEPGFGFWNYGDSNRI
jgi:hypothetical protein